MTNMLNKEFKLCASPLSWIFLLAAGMTLLPGYPILMGAFFVCFGVFHSFQNARESNDVLYTVLLPVRKADFVRAKYAFTCCLEIKTLGHYLGADKYVRLSFCEGLDDRRILARIAVQPCYPCLREQLFRLRSSYAGIQRPSLCSDLIDHPLED